MTYRVTVLTPTLVGDGQRLSPIDFMVWKDQVNVLDQNRIVKTLARGARLDSYLSQIKQGKLDFTTWGGLAQNFAGRRIPFEHASSAALWQRAAPENQFIPTFASGVVGPYLPASALKGALRSAVLCGMATESQLNTAAARAESEGRVTRQVTQSLEDSILGGGASNLLRRVAPSDSGPVAESAFSIYLLRIASLAARGDRFELEWRQSPRGTARRIEDSTALFCEMAVPGTAFEGAWRIQNPHRLPRIWEAVNRFAEQVLGIHARYAELAGLAVLASTIEQLRARLDEIRRFERGCLLLLGWGAGFLSKTLFTDTANPAFRRLLKSVPFYSRAIQSGLPFPKTRKILFLGNQPAALPGFVHLETV